MSNIDLLCAAAETAFGALTLTVCSLGFIIGVNEVLRGGR